jgi:hypothetical protein
MVVTSKTIVVVALKIAPRQPKSWTSIAVSVPRLKCWARTAFVRVNSEMLSYIDANVSATVAGRSNFGVRERSHRRSDDRNWPAEVMQYQQATRSHPIGHASVNPAGAPDEALSANADRSDRPCRPDRASFPQLAPIRFRSRLRATPIDPADRSLTESPERPHRFSRVLQRSIPLKVTPSNSRDSQQRRVPCGSRSSAKCRLRRS